MGSTIVNQGHSDGPQAELKITPVSQVSGHLHEYCNRFDQITKIKVDHVTLDLSHIHHLSHLDIEAISRLYQACDEQNIVFKIINTTDEVYQSLIEEALEFLEMIHCQE